MSTTTATSPPVLSFAVSKLIGGIFVTLRVAGTSGSGYDHIFCVSHREQPDDKTAVATLKEAQEVMQFFKVKMNELLAKGKSIAEYAYLTWLLAYVQWEDSRVEESAKPSTRSSTKKTVHFQGTPSRVPATPSNHSPPNVGKKRSSVSMAPAPLKKLKIAAPTPASPSPTVNHQTTRSGRRYKAVDYSMKKLMAAQLQDAQMSSDVEIQSDDSQDEDGYRSDSDSDIIMEEDGMEIDSDVFGPCGRKTCIGRKDVSGEGEDFEDFEERLPTELRRGRQSTASATTSRSISGITTSASGKESSTLVGARQRKDLDATNGPEIAFFKKTERFPSSSRGPGPTRASAGAGVAGRIVGGGSGSEALFHRQSGYGATSTAGWQQQKARGVATQWASSRTITSGNAFDVSTQHNVPAVTDKSDQSLISDNQDPSSKTHGPYAAGNRPQAFDPDGYPILDDGEGEGLVVVDADEGEIAAGTDMVLHRGLGDEEMQYHVRGETHVDPRLPQSVPASQHHQDKVAQALVNAMDIDIPSVESVRVQDHEINPPSGMRSKMANAEEVDEHDGHRDDFDEEDGHDDEEDEVAGGGTGIRHVEEDEEDELANDNDELGDSEYICPGTPGEDDFDLQTSESQD